MKTNMLNKGLLVIAMMVTLSWSAMAQPTVTTGGTANVTDGPDYVTVGSTMPYEVTPFDYGNMASFMNPSIYKWVSTGGTINATPVTGQDGYFNENSISVTWNATGTFELTATEKSMPKTGAGCDGSSETLTINVLPWPNVQWGAGSEVASSCDITEAVLPLTLKGSQSIDVQYTVKFTPFKGEEGTPAAATENFTNTGYDVAVDGASLTIPATEVGIYEVAIVGIQDKITKKSFSNTALVGASGTDFPSTTITFAKLPTPETNPIKHVAN